MQVQPIRINEGNCVIEGQHLVSKKLLEITAHILEDGDADAYKAVDKIVFCPDEPKDKFGSFEAETKTVKINLQRHFDNAVKVIKDEEEKYSFLSLRGHIWHALIGTVIHEIWHGIAFATDEELTKQDVDTVEAAVKELQEETVDELVRDYDVEPPSLEDEPFFGPRYMEFYIKHIKENAEQWAINQNAVHNDKAMWEDNGIICNTFREWYRVAYAHSADEDWEKDVSPIAEIETTSIVVETEPIENPVVEEPVVAISETKVKTDTPKPVETTQTQVSTDGLDAESLAYLDVEEDYESYEEDTMVEQVQEVIPQAPVQEQQTPEVAVAAPVQQELPLKTVSATTGCHSCSKPLQEGAKFCGFCGTSQEITPMPKVYEDTPAVAPQTNTPVAPMPSAQQFSYGAKRPMRHDLPNYNLSVEQIRAAIGEIIIRCYDHIFSKCGWSPGQEPSFAPEQRNAIMEPVSVVGVPHINEILVGMDSVEALNGQFTWCAPVVGGMIRGKISKNALMPMYTLYFNFNGHEAKRLIIPQNQWKQNNYGYSKPAVKAQQGAKIIWMIDGDDSATGKKWKAKVENDTLEWLI